MRTYGRIYDENGNPTWIEVATDANGLNDAVYLTSLVQAIKLNLGESPFYANVGIPQYQTVVTQVLPDYYMLQMQALYAPFFASLIVNRLALSNPPTYQVTAITHSGALLTTAIAT